jgi:hypothetical protein
LGKNFTNYPGSLGLVVLTLDLYVTRLERRIQTKVFLEELVNAKKCQCTRIHYMLPAPKPAALAAV